MEQLSLFVSSEGEPISTDFTVAYNPPIYLDEGDNYEISLIKSSQYYSWTNISQQQGNNFFEWSRDNGSSWETIVFGDGNYSISEINDHIPSEITIEPILALQKIKITPPANYQVNFRTGSFYGILGFAENTIISAGVNIAPHVADITNGIQAVVVHCDLVNPKYSYHNTGTSGTKSQILYVVSPPSLPPSSLYNVVEPGSSYYVPTNKTQINSIRFWLTDQNGKRINNQGENVNYHVILRKVKSSY